MLVTITRVINWSILFAFIACFSYQMIYLITPYIKKEKEHKTLQLHRYAVLIAARNEENVLGDLLDSIHAQNYPSELVDIYVVADNCSDKTAEVARKAGALVHERFSETGKGKGFALAWMFDRLFKLDKKYDAVCVFDADNLVHPNFLQEMNSRLCNGERIIQGYMDAKNPTDTWVSGVFAISFWIVNHVWSLAKYNMGLSCCLGGTGMCFDTEVLKRYGWRATCLTEDMEFTIQAMMEGIPTTWAHDAIIYDEKPLTFKQTWNQRKRWSQGHFDVADRYLIPMIKKAIKTRNIVMLDCSVNLIQPYFLMISTFFVLCSYIYNFYPFYTNILYTIIPVEVWTLVGIGQYIFPVAVLWKIRASFKSWMYLVLYRLFIYRGIPITAVGGWHRHDHEWSHTLHTRGISFDDVIIPEDAVNDGPKEVVFAKKDEK